MITVINGTNRPGNLSQVVARYYINKIEESGEEVLYLDLQAMPFEYLKLDSLKTEDEKIGLANWVQKFLGQTSKLVIVCPEYQGSYTGILKLFIDFVHPQYFEGKKIALVGVSKGRFGNLRGLDHLTGIFNYLRAFVLPQKVIISMVHTQLENEQLKDEKTKIEIEKQLKQFQIF